MGEFVDAVPVDDIPPESAAVVEVDGIEVAIVHTGGRFYALQNECPHGGAPIGDGDVVGDGVIECPGHGSSFTIATGEPIEGPADEALEVYEVDVVDGMVRVSLE